MADRKREGAGKSTKASAGVARESVPSDSTAGFRHFLVELATEPAKLGAFIKDPDAAMLAADLSEVDQAILKSGHPATIHARLSGQTFAMGTPTPVTVLVVDMAKAPGASATAGDDHPTVRESVGIPAQAGQGGITMFPNTPIQLFPQVQPQIHPQQVFPQIHPQQIFPQIHPQQIFPQIHPQMVVPPQIHPQFMPQQIFPQVHSQIIGPQILPQIVLPPVIPPPQIVMAPLQLVPPLVWPIQLPTPHLIMPLQIHPQLFTMFPQMLPQLVSPGPFG